MLTARRLTVYTHDRSRLTPRQRRRAVHKANRLDAKARAVALAAIAVLVAGCSTGGGHATGPTRSEAGPTPVRYRLAAEYVPTSTTTVAPVPSPHRAERSVSPAPGRPRRTPARAGGCSLDYIRSHENPHDPSGSVYGRSTNPGHFGAYQFDHQTWKANGGDPSHWGTASPAEQEAVAATTYARRGSSPWAVCG